MSPKGVYGNRNWTPEQIALVDELVSQGHTDAAIGKRIGRTANAVNVARKRYGIQGRTKATLTARKIARLLGLSCEKVVARWIRRRMLKGRLSGSIWHVSEDALVRFLENPAYWHLWSPERITDQGWREWAQELRGSVCFLTVGEVADRLGFGVGAVNDWLNKGLLPGVRNGNWLIRESDLQGFVAPIDRRRGAA